VPTENGQIAPAYKLLIHLSFIPTVKLVTRIIRSQAGENALSFLLKDAFRGSRAIPGVFPDFPLFILIFSRGGNYIRESLLILSLI